MYSKNCNHRFAHMKSPSSLIAILYAGIGVFISEGQTISISDRRVNSQFPQENTSFCIDGAELVHIHPANQKTGEVKYPFKGGKGQTQETAWILGANDNAKIFQLIEDFIINNGLLIDTTIPYEYAEKEGQHYVIISCTDPTGDSVKQWIDVSEHWDDFITGCQKIGIYVKEAEQLLDGITSREDADSAAASFSVLIVKIMQLVDFYDVPQQNVFPQLWERCRIDFTGLHSKIADIINNGCFGSKKLENSLMIFP